MRDCQLERLRRGFDRRRHRASYSLMSYRLLATVIGLPLPSVTKNYGRNLFLPKKSLSRFLIQSSNSFSLFCWSQEKQIYEFKLSESWGGRRNAPLFY